MITKLCIVYVPNITPEKIVKKVCFFFFKCNVIDFLFADKSLGNKNEYIMVYQAGV